MRISTAFGGLAALAATGLAGPVTTCEPSTVLSTVTETITTCPQSTTQYYFQVSSGSTIWIGSNTPASTDSITIGATETFTFVPVVPSSTTSTVFVTHYVSGASSVNSMAPSSDATTVSTVYASSTITASLTVYVTMTSSLSSGAEAHSSTAEAQSSTVDGLTTTFHYTSTMTESVTVTVTEPPSSESMTSVISSVGSVSSATSAISSYVVPSYAAPSFGGWNATTVAPPGSIAAGHTAANGTKSSPCSRATGTMPPSSLYGNSTALSTLTKVPVYSILTESTTVIPPGFTPSVVTYPGGFSTVTGYLSTNESLALSKAQPTFTHTPKMHTTFSESRVMSYSIPRQPSMSVYSASSVQMSYVPPTGPATLSNGTVSASMTSKTSSAPASTPSDKCDDAVEGEFGNFTVTWDDEPSYYPSNNNTYNFPPVFSPYHHLFFANGFAYVPKPNEPFTPVSGPHLAIFLPNLTTPQYVNIREGELPPGAIGAGTEATDSAYWFDAYSTYAACDNKGPAACDFTVTGYRYDDASQNETAVATQKTVIQPCPAQGDCSLTEIVFNDEFRNLSMISFDARYNSAETASSMSDIFLLDNLKLAWFNNSCAAGADRESGKL